MKSILRPEEVILIEQNAQNQSDLYYYGARILNIERLKWDEVISISNKGLILIKGNELTGYIHIKERHLFWSPQVYRIGEVFQAQSKFPKSIAPIDFLKIANHIFCQENFIENNEHPDSDKFDKYCGLYSLENNEPEKINLILYKNSKVIHSLYPQSKKYNERRNRIKYPYSRGEVKVSTDFKCRVIKIEVPYFAKGGILKYVLLIEKFYEKDIEEWRILIIDSNNQYSGDVLIGTSKIMTFSGDTSARITFQYCDLKNVEDAILKIEKNLL